jgi:NADH dehydrogenase
LASPGHPDIFVIGDLAAFPDPLPGVAQVAMQMGRHTASVVRQREQGQPPSAFRYRDLGSLAVIGRNAAVGQVFGRSVWGWFGWLIWSFIHLMQLVEFENRILVATQWLFNYLTFKRGARLIGNDDTSSIKDY